MNNSKSPWSWVPSLYFAEGLPNVAVMAISVIMYKQMGLSNAERTFYTVGCISRGCSSHSGVHLLTW